MNGYPGVPVYPVVEGKVGLAPQEIGGFLGEQLEGYPLSVSSGGLVQQMVVKAGPGRLFGFQCYSNKGSAQFIQLFDQEGGTVASGAVAVATFTVATIANLPISYPWPGRWFTRGIVIANSSVASTQTAGSADCNFDVQYF